MKDNMKKIYLFLLAAAGILAVASCAREELIDKSGEAVNEETTTLTFSFGETKTALVDGKTTWEAGDKIRVYTSNAGFYRDVEVPAEAVGKASFSADVNLKDTLYYAVYPIEACTGVSGGKVNVKLPTNPDGRFASANICAAATKGTELKFHNTTAVLKISVNSGNVVEILQINAKNTLVGNLAVEFDLAADTLKLTPSSPSKSATIAVGGIDGDYYVPVVPGTYAKEFSITALRGNGGYQNKITTNDNEVKVNTLFDLGVIGDNLTSGLEGEGTQEKPFLIRNLGEWTAFTASVNLGKDYSGEYVSLDTDLTAEAILTPVGYTDDDSDFGFGGTFLGNNHTVKVDLDGANCKSDENVALFGNVTKGASISNLTVEGKVVSPGITAAGVVGWARGANGSKITLENLTNNAEVTADDNVAGVVGYAYYTDIKNCKNTAKVTATTTTLTGLLLPYYSYYTVSGLNNDGASTWTYGTGGVAGFAQNSNISDCDNSADVAGYIKVAGVVGIAYWTNVTNANNSGNIKAAGNGLIRADSQYGTQWGSLAAGIAGWVHVQGTVTNCTNNGNVTGIGGVGGIVSLASCGNNASSGISIKNCVNNGELQATGSYSGGTSSCANVGAGGICAAASLYTYWSNGAQDKVVKIENCVNKGNVSVDNTSHTSDAVGGIVGNCYNPNRQNGSSVSVSGANTILNCVNEGQITGGYYVGGLVGLIGSRYGQIPVIKNSANHGKVVSNTPTGTSLKYSGILAGGLVGGVMAYNTTFRSRNMFNIRNCYNDADIVFAHESLATPYIGGIIGSTWGSGTIQNVYNTGNISLSTGAEFATGVTNALGALVGYQNASVITYSYFLNDILGGVAVSSKSAKPADASVVGFDDKFEFAGVVTIKDQDYETLVDVLNAWVAGIDNTGFAWKAGANGPVFDI